MDVKTLDVGCDCVDGGTDESQNGYFQAQFALMWFEIRKSRQRSFEENPQTIPSMS